MERFEELLGTAITEYTPNSIKFCGLSLAALEHVLAEGYTTVSAAFNSSPSVDSFIEFGQKCQRYGAIATFDGLALMDRGSPKLVIYAMTVIGVKELDFVGSFVRFVWGCDEIEINSHLLYAWWD